MICFVGRDLYFTYLAERKGYLKFWQPSLAVVHYDRHS